MIPTFRLSGSCLTMKMAHGLEWGPLVPPPLSGEACWVRDHVAGEEGSGEGESGRWGSGVEGGSEEVSESVGELDGEGWQCGC